MSEANTTLKKKKTWSEPSVRRMRLETEEQVLTFCKAGSYAGPHASSCPPGGLCQRNCPGHVS